MTTQQLSQAMKLAMDAKEYLADQHIHQFDGFALRGFEPIYCTLKQLAALVRWQAVQLNGAVDAAALQEVAYHGRNKFVVVGSEG